MGKAKKRSGKDVRHNPISRPPVQLPEDISQSIKIELPKNSLFAKLAGTDDEERRRAALTLVAACETREERREVLSLNGVEATVDKLDDAIDDVRLACVGALRNLISDEDEVYCDRLLAADGVGKTLTLFRKEMEVVTSTPVEKQTDEVIGVHMQTAEHCLLLLCSMCEVSQAAVEETTASNAPLLLTSNFESLLRLSPSLALAAAQFLLVISEDNDSVKAQISADTLRGVVFGGSVDDATRVTLASTMVNVMDRGDIAVVVQPILDIIEKCLQTSVTAIASDVRAIEGDKAAVLRQMFGISHRTLELLANMLVATDIIVEDGEDGWEEGEDEEGGDESANVDEAVDDAVTEAIIARLLSSTLADSVLTLAVHTEERVSAIVQSVPTLDFVSELGEATVCKACDVMGNFGQSGVTSEAMAALLQRFRGELSTIVSRSFSSQQAMVLDASLRSLFGVYKSLIQVHRESSRPSDEFLKMLAGVVTTSDAPDGAREAACALLGSLASSFQEEGILRGTLTAFSTALPAAPLAVATEVLDALFDAFAEDDFNHLLGEAGSIPALEQYVPHFKTLIQQGRKAVDAELIARAKDAHLNLRRFIKYKKSHM
eukprot:CAMPEP_0113910150 /NCGR_PEP_ID=MMETSP0780_2-20120614/27334_1 /TAXON_ID=652834 /ORGANISM="Palpitomonas bilix" /LENGTH=603 /DNA_ID=CAMNT_0000906211 /DNA_START=27 /DNA_END=1838 /DNA_ORIENTATION=- /assembly_acc=CAM_ASM_000599